MSYDNGLGVVKDLKQAFAWYRKAAEQGLASAQFTLGVMYHNGLGIDQDEKTACEWYRQAAEQGHNKARNYHASLYAKFGTPEQIITLAERSLNLVDAKDSADNSPLSSSSSFASSKTQAMDTSEDELGAKSKQELATPSNNIISLKMNKYKETEDADMQPEASSNNKPSSSSMSEQLE